MSVKRMKDPAGLLGDHVKIDLTDPQPGDWDTFNSLLAYNSPKQRIERLRRHASLWSCADELAVDFARATESTIASVLASIAEAETKALYLDAAPSVSEKRRRLAARQMKNTDKEIQAAMLKHKTQERAAEALKISVRQLSTRWKAIKNRKS